MQQVLELKGETQLKTVFLLNNWWQERNTAREGGQRRLPESLAILCGRQAAQILALQVCETAGRSRQTQKWHGPQPGMLKLNVDGAFLAQDDSGGWGYVIRDEDGAVIQSGAGRVDFACNPLHMELKACIQGVGAAIELGISHLVLETDAQQAVWAIQSDDL